VNGLPGRIGQRAGVFYLSHLLEWFAFSRVILK